MLPGAVCRSPTDRTNSCEPTAECPSHTAFLPFAGIRLAFRCPTPPCLGAPARTFGRGRLGAADVQIALTDAAPLRRWSAGPAEDGAL